MPKDDRKQTPNELPAEGKAAPTDRPPQEASVKTADPTPGAPDLNIEEFIQRVITREAGPTMTPPAEVIEAAAAAEAVTAWQNAVKVTGLWINAAHRNAYAAIQGLGWRKIIASNDSAFVNMVQMLSHAKQMNSNCNVRIESDGQIHEVYVW